MIQQVVNGTITNYTVDARNCVTSEVTNGIITTYTHNAAGDLVADSRGNSWLYDYEGRLAEYSNGTGQLWRYYNAWDDIRVKRETWGLGGLVSTDYTYWEFGGQINEYVQPAGGPASLSASWSYTPEYALHALTTPAGIGGGHFPYLTDEEDNVFALVDATQTFRNLYEYSAFGTLVTNGGLVPISDRMKYKSTALDSESGSYSVFKRMYDPSFARYTGQSPYNRTDYASTGFLMGRPLILRPEDGVKEDYASLSPDYSPIASAGRVLPWVGSQLPVSLSDARLQWSYELSLRGRERYESCGETAYPTNSYQLGAGFYELLNGGLSLKYPARKRAGAPRPEVHLSVDNDGWRP
jgi:hypothetical protein